MEPQGNNSQGMPITNSDMQGYSQQMPTQCLGMSGGMQGTEVEGIPSHVVSSAAGENQSGSGGNQGMDQISADTEVSTAASTKYHPTCCP